MFNQISCQIDTPRTTHIPALKTIAKIQGNGDEKRIALPLSCDTAGKVVRVLVSAEKLSDEKCDFTV